MKIQSILSPSQISRYYVSNYEAAMESEKVDAKLFADLAEQRRFFACKLADAKRSHRDALNTAVEKLTDEKKTATDEKEKARIQVALSAIALELAQLK